MFSLFRLPEKELEKIVDRIADRVIEKILARLSDGLKALDEQTT